MKLMMIRFKKKKQEETEAYGAFNESTEGAQAKGCKKTRRSAEAKDE